MEVPCYEIASFDGRRVSRYRNCVIHGKWNLLSTAKGICFTLHYLSMMRLVWSKPSKLSRMQQPWLIRKMTQIVSTLIESFDIDVACYEGMLPIWTG